MLGPKPLAPKQLLGVDCNNPQEHFANGLAAMCEGMCAESFACLSEVTPFYKNIVSVLGAAIAQSV